MPHQVRGGLVKRQGEKEEHRDDPETPNLMFGILSFVASSSTPPQGVDGVLFWELEDLQGFARTALGLDGSWEGT